MNEDIVRVLRIYEIKGPRSWVEDVVQRSIQGTKIIDTGKSITGVTIHPFPEIIKPKDD